MHRLLDVRVGLRPEWVGPYNEFYNIVIFTVTIIWKLNIDIKSPKSPSLTRRKVKRENEKHHYVLCLRRHNVHLPSHIQIYPIL